MSAISDSLLKPYYDRKNTSQHSPDNIESNKQGEPPSKSLAAIRHEHWKSLLNSITQLFTNKKLQRLELDVLMEKVRKMRDSDIGPFIVDSYKGSILKKGMIVLREQIKDQEKVSNLLEILGKIWHEFYTKILPYLEAIFLPIKPIGATLNFRSINLIGFRDMVVLNKRTKINDHIEPGKQVSGKIKQMLLVLSSVHEKIPETGLPTENCLRIEEITARVILPFMGSNGLWKEKQPVLPKQKSKCKNPSSIKETTPSRLLRENITRKFRNSSSINSNPSELNNNKQTNSTRLRSNESPKTETKPLSLSNASNSSKMLVDDDMIEYLDVRYSRWRIRDQILNTESLT